MIPLNSYSGLLSRLNVICKKRINRCLVALVFADPGFELVKKEIIPFLNRFNVRSGEMVHFFFAGFVTDRESQHYADSSFVIAGPNNLNWSFSAKAFDCIRSDLEKQTKWRYSGGVDFILLDGYRDSGRMNLRFDEVVTMNLLEGRDKKSLPALSQLFEEIFRFAESAGDNATTYAFSDSRLPTLCRSIAEGALDAWLPKDVAKAYREGRSYAVRNIRQSTR